MLSRSAVLKAVTAWFKTERPHTEEWKRLYGTNKLVFNSAHLVPTKNDLRLVDITITSSKNCYDSDRGLLLLVGSRGRYAGKNIEVVLEGYPAKGRKTFGVKSVEMKGIPHGILTMRAGSLYTTPIGPRRHCLIIKTEHGGQITGGLPWDDFSSTSKDSSGLAIRKYFD